LIIRVKKEKYHAGRSDQKDQNLHQLQQGLSDSNYVRGQKTLPLAKTLLVAEIVMLTEINRASVKRYRQEWANAEGVR
jgi:hypothetical protein